MMVGSADAQGVSVLPQLKEIQYLRALAAIAVLLFHAGQITSVPLHLGGWGVDLFFVISGFLMVAITDDRTRALPFLLARLLRVAPLYWIATAVWLSLRILVGAEGIDGRHVVASLLFLPIARPGADEHFFPVLDVGWTLNYELSFYALFTITLIAPQRWRVPLLTAILGTLVIVGRFVDPADAPLGFWTNPIILEFLAGAWLAAAWLRRPTRRPRLGWWLVALTPYLMVIVQFALHTLQLPLSVWRAALGLPATMLLAGALLVGSGAAAGVIRRVALLLGDASYALYLFHRPALLIGSVMAARLGIVGWPALLLLTVAALIAGVLAHLVLERPLLRWLRRAQPSSAR